jgi:predicted TPR repeat methyltransferase
MAATAAEAYSHRMQPEESDSVAWEQRGIRAREAGRHTEAEACFAKAVAQDERPLSWLGLALSQIDLQRNDDAVTSLLRARALSPKSGVIAHLIDSLSGHAPRRAPDTYVNWLFSSYAGRFDNHLARLGYQGPDMLLQLAVRAGWVADARRMILDLGCGTGLSGVPFRTYAARLSGIDLAAQMLELAQRRGIYDALQQDEVHVALAKMPESSCDVVLAADTLIYIGDIGDLFGLVSRVMKPGGSFLFTVETGDIGYALSPTGRYSHAEDYLRRCALGKLHYADHIDAVIRIEEGKVTPGRAYRFTKLTN